MIGLKQANKTAETKVSKNESELDLVKEKVTHNELQISTCNKQQEDFKKLFDERFNSTSHGLPDTPSYGQGLTIELVLVGQAKYTAAIQLGNRPTMTFNGDLDRYVQFVTMFRTTFDGVVKNSSAICNLLSLHVTGPSK